MMVDQVRAITHNQTNDDVNDESFHELTEGLALSLESCCNQTDRACTRRGIKTEVIIGQPRRHAAGGVGQEADLDQIWLNDFFDRNPFSFFMNRR